jgi:ArsR family transcriptional regulator
MTDNDVIVALGSLAQETRLQILRYLVKKGSAGASAGQVSDAVGATPSRASFHLATLSKSGIIKAERQSRSIIYSVDYQALSGILNYLIEDCCGNASELQSCCGISRSC